MKSRWFRWLASLFLASVACATALGQARTDVRVMSFNIRYGTANDGENHWDKRKEFLIETIKTFNPDLLGTQETLGFQRDYLAAQLNGYDVLGVGRDDGKDKGEMTALYFKRDRFERLDSGHFWLSETPDVPGSKNWDAALTRMVTWVKLRDKRNLKAKPLMYFNTHFDHRGEQARVESARLIRRRIAEAAQTCRVIVTGDFNAGEENEAYRAFFSGADAPVFDAYRAIHSTRTNDEGTFSSFKVTETKGPRIDWIGASREWQAVSAAIDRTARDGRTPSDHFPVVAVLRPTTLTQANRYDLIIRNGMVYDGTGRAPRRADVGIRGAQIATLGNLANAQAATVIDAKGLAVAPGFINMLSHSWASLIVDGRSLGELKQGVTTQIMGEGASMGPWSEEQKRLELVGQGDLKYPIEWTTLGEYLRWLERRGVSQNFASYIGATTIRVNVLGWENRKATPAEMERMRELVRRDMEAGALGIGSSLIYAPAFFAPTEELIELCKVAAQYRGKYISHIRSESNQLIEGVEELLRIAREAKIPAEIYHLKAAGKDNWPKMARVLEMVEKARREGLKITADMYTYPAGGTGLTATMPPWVLDGGYEALYQRLQDPATRAKIAEAMKKPADNWENFYLLVGSPDKILLAGFKSEALKPLTGKTLAEVAKLRGKDPTETAMDLILEDRSRVGTIYFMMSEENIKTQFRRPWVSLGSDAASMATEGVFLKSAAHPRAYGTFARFLGKYVRDEKLMPLAEAIRRMTGLPATNLELDRRGFLRTGYFADVVVFDPKTIADKATFEQPHQYAVGVQHVVVNGQPVLKDGEHTSAKSGRALYGPGKVK